MGITGAILLIIIIFFISRGEKSYQKQQMQFYHDYKDGKIDSDEYTTKSLDLTFKRLRIK